MCGRESLTDRLKNARLCFAAVSGDDFLATAPEDVREIIAEFRKSKGGRVCRKATAPVRSAIFQTLVEFGRQDIRMFVMRGPRDRSERADGNV
jgi:hypothetical protein